LAGVPTNGKSAIDVAQPPSASADARSAAKANSLFFRFPDIRPGSPHIADVNLAAPRRLSHQPLRQTLKPLLPETIKA
jgi:hypothetical protein